MSITNHVVSLPVAKELSKVLPEGWKGEFYWVNLSKGIPPKGMSLSDWFLYPKKTTKSLKAKYPHNINFYPALLLTELLELLPKHIGHKNRTYSLLINAIGDYLDVTYYTWGKIYGEDSRDVFEQEGINHKGFSVDRKLSLPTIIALLYIWLHENGYLNKKESE